MKESWPEVKLGEFIQQRKDFIFLEDDKEYRRVTVHLHAKGIELRDIVQGYTIKTKKQFPIKANDLLVAEIDAKVGGYGIVPSGLEGAVVSSHYYLYEIDQSIIDIHFLGYWLQTPSPLEQIQQFIRGALNYAAIRPYHFLEFLIPLPPLSEQRRIVNMVEKVEKAKWINQRVMEEIEMLKAALLDQAFRGEL